MLSQSHHLARTSASAAARSIARPGRGRRLVRHRVAAAVAAAALLAAACSTEEPPAPTAEETVTTTTAAAAPADTAAPDTTAAPAVTSPCNDPDAEDLGDGLVELDGVVFEVYADACVPRLEEPAGDDDTAAQDTAQAEAQPEQSCIDDVCVDVPEDGGPVELPEGFANHEHPPETESDYQPESGTVPEPETDPESEQVATTTVAPEPDPEPTSPDSEPEVEDPTSTTLAPEPEPGPEPTTTVAPEPEPEPETTTTVAPEPDPDPEPEPTAPRPVAGETVSFVVPMEAEPQNPDGTWPPRRFERMDIQVGETIHLVFDPDSVSDAMEHKYSPELPCVYDLGCYEPVRLEVGTVLVLSARPDWPLVVVRIEDQIVFHNIWVCWFQRWIQGGTDRQDEGWLLHRLTAPPNNAVMEGIYSIEKNLGDYYRPC